MSTHQHIIQRIANIKAGKILFPVDFRGVGADSAIKMSLSRIAQKGSIVRLSNGIYMKTKKSGDKAGIMGPEDIAKAVAEKEKIRIKPAGAYALFLLGFTNEKPAVFTYVTDGEPRRISIGESIVVFKSTTPKKLSMIGKVSSILIQAIEDTGQKNISEEMLEFVKQALHKEDQLHIDGDMKKAPAWIYNLLYKIKGNNKF
ncbi:MAG: hypothetical protein EOP48_17640 [Sphingobacteriales bacterium]|nr:MAG: hypothetical protein EOP48_17640 [Sphingobacteriales bacterium]